MPGGKNCCIVGCTNYNSKTSQISYVSFPRKNKDKFTDEWRAKLIVAVCRADAKFKPDTHHICTVHFEQKCLWYHGKGFKLAPGSLPTLHMPTKSIETSKLPPRKEQEMSGHRGLKHFKNSDEHNAEFVKPSGPFACVWDDCGHVFDCEDHLLSHYTVHQIQFDECEEPSEDPDESPRTRDVFTASVKQEPGDIQEQDGQELINLQPKKPSFDIIEEKESRHTNNIKLSAIVFKEEPVDDLFTSDNSMSMCHEDDVADVSQSDDFGDLLLARPDELSRLQQYSDNSVEPGMFKLAGSSNVDNEELMGTVNKEIIPGKQAGRMSLRPRKNITYRNTGLHQCHHCLSASFEKLVQLRQHLSTCAAAQKQKTRKWSKHFRYDNFLSVSQVDSNGFYPCPKCSVTFVSLPTLLTHLILCNSETTSLPFSMETTKNVHSNRAFYVCPKCNEGRFTRLDTLKQHLKECINKVPQNNKSQAKQLSKEQIMFECRKCDATFSDVYLFRYHVNECQRVKELLSKNRAIIAKKVRNGKFDCRKCGTEFPSFRLLNFHEQECIVAQRGTNESISFRKNNLICQESLNILSTEPHVSKAANVSVTSKANTLDTDKRSLRTLRSATSNASRIHYSSRDFVDNFSCQNCDRKFIWKASFDKHSVHCVNSKKRSVEEVQQKNSQITNKPEPVYSCDTCSARFAYKRTYEKHTRSCPENTDTLEMKQEAPKPAGDDGAVYMCKTCEARFAFKKTYEKHVVSCVTSYKDAKKPRITYCCSNCATNFIKKEQYDEHTSKCNSAINPLRCPSCYKWFTAIKKCNKHKEMCPYVCMKCKSSFLDPQLFSTHVEFCQYRCRHCGLSCSSSAEKEICTGYPENSTKKRLASIFSVGHTCKSCDKHYTKEDDLEDHKVNGCSTWHFCSKCSAKFTWMLSRDTHSSTCGLPDVPVRCDLCCVAFTSSTQLNEHQKNCPMSCEKCLTTFIDPTLHKLHVKHCSVQPELSLNEQDPTNSIDDHQHPLDHCCPTCDTYFTTKIAFSEHIIDCVKSENITPGSPIGTIYPMSLIEIKPSLTPDEGMMDNTLIDGVAKCVNCKQIFPSSYDLHQHQLNCPFSCVNCGVEFSEFEALLSHLTSCTYHLGTVSPLDIGIKQENDLD